MDAGPGRGQAAAAERGQAGAVLSPAPVSALAEREQLMRQLRRVLDQGPGFVEPGQAVADAEDQAEGLIDELQLAVEASAAPASWRQLGLGASKLERLFEAAKGVLKGLKPYK
jgi:hypothetical protein